MDLFLMDAMLKGIAPDDVRVLDVGCGEGRNGIHFIREGYDYVGIDKDPSRVRLIEYMASSLPNVSASFSVTDLHDFSPSHTFDLIICSRLLHFASDAIDFGNMWKALERCLSPNGIIYGSMDSAIDNALAVPIGVDGQFCFPDGKTRFALTNELYSQIKKGFEEIEPLRTLVHHQKRAQSFFLFKKC